MPCYDRMDDARREQDDKTYHEQRNEILELRNRNDKLARLLCIACKELERNELKPSIELSLWWNKHKEFDKQEGR